MTSRSDPKQSWGLRASIGTKFALAVCLVLGIVSTWVGSELIDSSRKGLIDAKRRAATMVVDAFAPTLVPALDFGDADAVAESARLLRAGKDVVAVAIWAGQEPDPVVAIPRPPAGRREPTSDHDEMIGTSVVVTRRLVSPAGKEVGALRVKFTTLPEQEAARRARHRIAATTALLALLVAGTVLGIARLEIVGPLRRLLLAMDAVASGQDATVPIRSRDEVGQLSSMFNQMSVAIRDRERSLQDALERLQGLLDGMRQAIIVVDSNGILPGLRSRQAELMFSPERLQGDPAPLLFGDRPESVERIAFVQWLTLALGAASEERESLRELAPTETVVRDAAGSRRELELEFRPILDQGRIARLMVLCTDVTASRELERQVAEKDKEHERQMRAMRNLAAGGAQLVVNLLASARSAAQRTRQVICSERPDRTDLASSFRAMHTIRGEAQLFNLETVTAAASQVESTLVRLGDDATPASLPGLRAELLANLDNLDHAVTRAETMLVEASPTGRAILDQVTVRRSDLDAIEPHLATASADLAALLSRLTARPFGELVLGLPDAAQRWAERAGKLVALDIRGTDVMVPRKLAAVLSGVVTHLVRNAVAHGIESAADRAACGKDERGIVTVSCRPVDDGVEMQVTDDGAGLAAERVASIAASIGLKPSAPEDSVFAEGLSTAGDADAPDALAGRGMGLAAVRQDLAAVGYEVSLRSERGRGVQVVVRPHRPVVKDTDIHGQAIHPGH